MIVHVGDQVTSIAELFTLPKGTVLRHPTGVLAEIVDPIPEAVGVWKVNGIRQWHLDEDDFPATVLHRPDVVLSGAGQEWGVFYERDTKPSTREVGSEATARAIASDPDLDYPPTVVVRDVLVARSAWRPADA